MFVDYHAHTVLCRHATGTVEEYLQTAEEKGLAEFGFAEHSWWMARQPNQVQLCPTRDEFELYFRWMDKQRAIYDGTGGKPVLRVGLEADWVPDVLSDARHFIRSYPFDYIHGSVHHLRLNDGSGDWRISWKIPTPAKRLYIAAYFEEVLALAQSGLCDVLAHIDVIRRGESLDVDEVAGGFERILPALAETGVAAEINTSGLDNELGAFQPCEPILRMLVEAGVPITFGSDAHGPAAVGRYLDRAAEYLRQCGGTSFVRFEQRRRHEVALPEEQSVPGEIA